MADAHTPRDPDDRDQPETADEIRQRDEMRSGKGKREEVGPTGIYPASLSDDAPADAEIRAPGELGHVTPGKEALTVIDKPSDSDEV